ncbi:MAG: WbqC family protein [candidate division KSB1 bacterium]|nr:WbqC family protein [candidate division KSB1 bacterium]
MIEKQRRHLASLTFSSFLFLCKKMRILSKLVKSSDCPPVSERSRRVCAWLEVLDCGTYLIDADDLRLIDSDFIVRHGFTVSEFCGSPPVYPQVFDHFYPNLSGLDMLFNTGEQSPSLLKKSFQAVPVGP